MSKKLILYGKRGLVYALGLFIMAIGVVFSVKCNQLTLRYLQKLRAAKGEHAVSVIR